MTDTQRLFNRDFALLMSGNVVSTLGSSVYLIAIVLLLKELTESAFILRLFQILVPAAGRRGPVVRRVITEARAKVFASSSVSGVFVVSAAILVLFVAVALNCDLGRYIERKEAAPP